MSCFLGIDIGTSGTKVIVLSPDGEVLDHEIYCYTFEQPQAGWSEQDPKLWVNAVAQCMAAINQRQQNLSIACIGLSGQMHGMTALDTQGKVIRPCILWNDQRNGIECDEILASLGGIKSLSRYTNNSMLVGFTAGKIRWFEKNEPHLFEKTSHILNPKDYIRFCLTGELATEVSEASGTGLLDVVNRRWSLELMEKIGIDAHLMPACYESTYVSGYTNQNAPSLFGIKAGIPVIGGGGDAVIQTLGCGIYQPGVAQTTLGTGGVVAAVHRKPLDNSDGRIQVSCNVLKDTWHNMGVSLSAGSALAWWKNILSQGAENTLTYEALIETTKTIPIGSEGLIFLPYLMGERCPYSNPSARGGFIGARQHHQQNHFNRAVLEGISFSLNDIMQLVVPQKNQNLLVYASGGGSRSDYWNQMQADIYGCTLVKVQNSSHGGALGAAILAAIALEHWKLDDIQTLFATEKQWQPNRDNSKKYRHYIEIYQRLHDRLLEVNNALSQVR